MYCCCGLKRGTILLSFSLINTTGCPLQKLYLFYISTFIYFTQVFIRFSFMLKDRSECLHKHFYWIGVRVDLNPWLSWHKSVQQGKGSPPHQQIGLKLVECYIWSIGFYGAETCTLWKVDQEYLQSFEMCCWRRLEKIGWTSKVRNEEVLQRVKEEVNILRTVKVRKANWIGYILHR